MAGPFQSYVPPGVYTETENEAGVTGPPTGLQIPVFIGTGNETLRRTDLDLVRGSSPSVDQLITDEDVSGRFVLDDSNPDNLELGDVDGQTDQFKVKNFPIVQGDGSGTTTNRPQDVEVTVDGTQVAVESVTGEDGLVTLQVPPPSGSTVLITYSFNRTDTLQTDDLSEQVSDYTAVLKGDEPETYDINSNQNDLFRISVDGTAYDITLQNADSRTASQIVNDIDAANISGLAASVDVDNQGRNRVQLEANGSLEILDGTANDTLGFVSGQKTDRNRVFYTYDGPIVDGSDGGIVTNDVDDITVTVDSSVVEVASLDGSNNRLTLVDAPPVGSTVEVEYYHNTFQNTFDYLPDNDVTSVERVGNAPGRLDFSEGQDFIVRDGKILWGTSFTIEPGITTPGSEPFDDSEISASLRGDRIFFEPVERFDDLGINSTEQDTREIQLGNIPTEGDGRDTPTEDVNKVHIYHGEDLTHARERGEVTVTRVIPEERKVVVEDTIPSQDNIFAIYWYNRLRDDEYTVEKHQSGGVTINSDLRAANLFNVRFGTSTASDTISWPSGVETEPDAFIQNATDAVSETVTVTFTTTDEGQAVLLNDSIDPYDIFATESDHLAFTFNDGDNGVNDTVDPVDLNTSGFGVLVSDPHDSGTTFNPSQGTDATFDFEHEGTNYSADLTAATGSTIADMAEVIWRSVPNETEIQGTNTESFDFTTDQDYDVTINGTNTTGTLTGTSSESASDVATSLEGDIESNTNLIGGDITDPSNDFDVIANSDGTVSIVASEELSVNDSSGQANDPLEVTLGWDTGDVPNDDSINNAYTLGNTLSNTKIARTWEGSSREYLLLRNRSVALNPRQAEDLRIRVLTGNANSLLNFDDFQTDHAVESAVNKGATVVSNTITSTDISNLANDEDDFVVSIDGTEYTVDGSNFSGVTTLSGAATQIDNVIGSAGTAVEEPATTSTPGRIRITSSSNDDSSSVEIGGGPANDHLQFNEGQTGGQRKATSDEATTVMNNDTAAWADNSTGSTDLFPLASSGEFLNASYAEAIDEEGYGDFIEIKSFGVGTDVDITVEDPSADSALNDTGIGFDIGDSATGTAGQDGFNVTSTNSNGSSGSGVVGQTYVDDNTSLTFTVQNPVDGGYADNDTFTLIVEEDMNVGPSLINRAIPGLEMSISNIGDVEVGDTSLVETFDKSGEEPGIGDFYYITYNHTKDDFSTKLFTRFEEIQSEYGDLDPNNPLTLASYLAVLNGAQVIGSKQVQSQPGSQQASQQAYFDAIRDLNTSIQPGITPDIIVPLTTDSEVQAQAVKNAEIQSSQRYGNERRVILGVPSGTLPNDAKQLAEGLDSSRAVLMYPDSAIITLTDALGRETSNIVDGRYLAAAMAGSAVSPAFDVATPWTGRELVGFDRLNRDLNSTEKNQLATSGITVLNDEDPNLEVRQGFTTNTDNRLTSTPSVIAIKDFVQQQTRSTLNQFVGLKNLQGRSQDVESAVNGLMRSLVESDIITSFTGVSATPDQDDPTQLNVEAFYSPVFPLLYIPVKFTVSSNSVE